MIRAKNHSPALVYLEESISSYPRGRQSGECRFWLHRLYTERGLHDRALETARDSVIINPDSPYTWLLLAQLSGTRTEKELGDEYRKRLDAKDEGWALFYHALLMVRQGSLAKGASRIRDLSSPDIARYRDMEKAITGLHTASSHGGALKRIDRYFAVGHLPAVYRELRPLLAEEESRKDRLIALAHYGGKYGHAYLDVYSRLQLLRHFKLKENITLMPEASSRALFPRPFGECADTWAGRHSIRKNILYAVMKAESLFRHNAVSSAGAKGLMQIMPATARGIARSLGMKSFDLTEPCTSIRLGSSYIADLDRQFKGIFPHMVAAYNAGPGNVRKWQDRMAGEDMDYFTEFTPFLETRYYILRTGKFLAQYGLIYPGPNAVK
ncbi:MAG: hypothetical protein E4G96_10420 [Chrysiogenales bacterium]|nr:MAG: hypothetical protein E4G96_10420 [Chrysiogenales bacterium]